MTRFYHCFYSAFHGLLPRQRDPHVRQLQASFIHELAKGQQRADVRDCERVGSREYLYMEIEVKGKQK